MFTAFKQGFCWNSTNKKLLNSLWFELKKNLNCLKKFENWGCCNPFGATVKR